MNKQRLVINLLIIFTIGVVQAGCISKLGSSPEEISLLTETSGPIESEPSDTSTPITEEISRPTEIPEPIESEPSDTSTPITVKLILSKAPRLNEQAELIFIISSILDAPDTQAAIILPEGTELISGDLEWSGALKANESHTLKATIMFVTEGNKSIEAKALYELENGDIWGDAAYLYLNTTVECGQVGFSSEPTHISSGEEEKPPAITPINP